MKKNIIVSVMVLVLFCGGFVLAGPGLTSAPSGAFLTDHGTAGSCVPEGNGTAYFCNINVPGTGTIATPVLGGTSITVTNGGSDVVLTLNQQDVTNNPAGFVIDNLGTGNSLVINSTDVVVDSTGKVGINTATPFANLHVNGSLILKTVEQSTATYTVLEDDYMIINTYSSTGTSTTTLATVLCNEVGENGRVIEIKDGGFNATANNITVDTEGSETIDGIATYPIMVDKSSVTVVCHNSNWLVK